MRMSCLVSFLFITLISFVARPASAAFADEGSITGTVTDAFGARIGAASIRLLRDGQSAGSTIADAGGRFTFAHLAEGRYRIEAAASGFEKTVTDPMFVGASSRATADVLLQIGPLHEDLLVTAAANAVPESQVGASVTVLGASTIQNLGNTDLLEPLRSVPGVQFVQLDGRGGATSLFVRGGSSNFTKVLVDGVPANDIGGAFDFADLATTAVESVEVLRGSNSVLYGSDALTGVINIATKRGRSRTPEANLSVDGGNLSTSHADASLGGAVQRVDYFADFSHLATDNSVPNNAYHNSTFATRVGAMLGTRTNLSGTVRYIDTSYGSPNAFDYYGIADDSSQTRKSSYTSIAADSQITDRWTSTIRFGVSTMDYHYVNPSPTGQPSDSSAFANYLGNVVTITGANGYSVTGRAILDYSGTYPSTFDSSVTRSLLYGETTYQVASALELAGGIRVESEHGTATSSATTKTDRSNYGGFAEARVSAGGWLYVNGGLSVDHNEVFGDATTPRVSAAAYLRKPSSNESLGDTKLTFNAGKGIKEPSLSQELSSLYDLIPPATAASLGLSPIGPERSTSVDAGVEQGLAGGHGRVRLSYFHNDFSNLIEYVSAGALPKFGVPAAAASASGYGAYLNSQSNRSQGVEFSGEAVAGHLRVTGSYMYLDAVVTQSLSSGALSPAFNPAFPGIPIGVYSPLVGARPFRRPTNSGSLVGVYSAGKAMVSVAGYFFGKQDDSTLLSDQFFGNTMLLPNADMDPAYQKINLSGTYQLLPRLRWYVTIENAFNATYEAAGGFPALPRAARTGVTVTLGGDR
jgi:vitamin B12 transporter